MTKLAIITVVYNNYLVLDDFVKSLAKNSHKNYFLYIVDLSDNDKKQSINKLIDKKLIKNNQYEIIDSRNKGYGHGVNHGLREATNQGYELFCVVNSDIIFDKNFIRNSLISLKGNPSTIVGGKIYYAPGYEYHKDQYQKRDLGKVIWYAGGVIDWKNVLINHQGVDKPDRGQYDQFKETKFITGCLMFFDKSVVDKVGFWDEKYFLYYEDVDFCQRAKQKEIKLYYNPSIVIWHKNAQSTGGSGSETHQKFQQNSRLRFGLKYAPFKTKLHLLKNSVIDLTKKVFV